MSAVEEGLITEKDIDVSIRRILGGLFELGFFDPASIVPWSGIPYSNVDSQEHKDHALKVARQSVVLLKNDNDLLPVEPSKVRKIAVVGPNADDDKMMLGNYNGTPSHTVTILEGIRNAYPEAEVTYERGCDLVEGYVYVDPRLRRGFRAENYEGLSAEQMAEIQKMEKERQALLAAAPKPIPSENYTPEALAEFAARTAEGADVIFFVGGLAPTVEGEEMKVALDGFKGGDREKIELPEIQGRMLKALKATGKPVVFVLCSGSAVALEQNEADYDALVCAWYGGQAGGTAVGDIVSGKISPSGRLPITFYKSTAQLPDFLDYNMKGRTYRYMTEKPLYPFGYGLSYADFSYGKAKLSSKSIKAGESVTDKVDLKNNSNVASDEVVQIYVKRLGDADAPVKALKGFQRVSMNGGEKKSVSIELPASSFEYYDSAADDLIVKPGKYQILYGSSSADADLKALPLTIK